MQSLLGDKWETSLKSCGQSTQSIHALLDLLFRLAATFVRMINEAITHSFVKCCDLWQTQVNAVHG